MYDATAAASEQPGYHVCSTLVPCKQGLIILECELFTAVQASREYRHTVRSCMHAALRQQVPVSLYHCLRLVKLNAHAQIKPAVQQ